MTAGKIETTEDMLAFFEGTMKRCRDIMATKNKDYATGAGGGPFANFELAEVLHIAQTERGLLIRVIDKIQRILTFLNAGKLEAKGESVRDALDDIINYCVLLEGILFNKQADKDIPF